MHILELVIRGLVVEGLLEAEKAALQADCTRRHVGAAVVTYFPEIVARGCNGVVPGATPCSAGGCPRGLLTREDLPSYQDGPTDYQDGPGRCVGPHAEAKAHEAAQATGTDLSDCLLAITDPPCDDCRAWLIDTEYINVVWPGGQLFERNRI